MRTKRKGLQGEENFAKEAAKYGYKVYLSPGSRGSDAQIKTKMFGKLRGEVKVRGGNAFNFDYKSINQAINKFLAKRQVDAHTRFNNTMPYLITVKFDFFMELLKIADELAELKGVRCG